MLTKFIFTKSPMVKLMAKSSTVSGLNPMEMLFWNKVFTAPSGMNEPIMSPISPPTTAAKIKAISKNVISRPFKPFAPYLSEPKKSTID